MRRWLWKQVREGGSCGKCGFRSSAPVPSWPAHLFVGWGLGAEMFSRSEGPRGLNAEIQGNSKPFPGVEGKGDAESTQALISPKHQALGWSLG